MMTGILLKIQVSLFGETYIHVGYSVTYMTEVTGKSKLVPHSNTYPRFI